MCPGIVIELSGSMAGCLTEAGPTLSLPIAKNMCFIDPVLSIHGGMGPMALHAGRGDMIQKKVVQPS